MKLSASIYRRAKRDGRNPSTGAKTISLEEPKEVVEKSKEVEVEIQPGD